MEVVLDAGASADVEDTELAPKSSRLSEHEEDKNFVAAEEIESKKLYCKQTKAEVVPISKSPVNSSPSHASFSTDETVSTVLVHSDKPNSISAPEEEMTEVKTEEGLELKEENVTVSDNSVQETSAGADVSEDTNMDMSHSSREEKTHTDEKMDPDTKERIVTQEEAGSLSCSLRVSMADDLDEMMDIGTVDEVEQEAQMKEEEQSYSTDMDKRSSPAISSTGKLQV